MNTVRHAGIPPRAEEGSDARARSSARRWTCSASAAFEAVTVEQICAAADVAKGTFFLHFSSKAALLERMEPRARDAGSPIAARSPRESRQCSAAVPRAGRGSRRTLAAPARRGARAAAPAARFPRADRAASDRDLRAVVEAVVRRGQERGEFRRNVSPRLAAAALLATCAAALRRAMRRPATTPEALRNELLHALLHGLSEPKPRLKWTRPAVIAMAGARQEGPHAHAQGHRQSSRR